MARAVGFFGPCKTYVRRLFVYILVPCAHYYHREAAVMSNMYGYSDYSGPNLICDPRVGEEENHTTTAKHDKASVQDTEDLEQNPLQVGFWMEGDSLAPPCGSGIPTIHKFLEFAEVSSKDTVYDLGCGDGRVCIEAFARHGCVSVGVEVEDDLVDRAKCLISKLPQSSVPAPKIVKDDLRRVLKMLVHLVKKRDSDDENGKSSFEGLGLCLPLPTVIIMYLLPAALREIEGDLVILLKELPMDLRIVCNTWGLASLKPVKREDFREESGSITSALLYTKESLLD